MKKIYQRVRLLFKAASSFCLLVVLSVLLGSSGSGCKKMDCSGYTVYGPKPCDSDEECVQENGQGWYCNKEHAYTNPCDEKTIWPLCEPKK